METAQYKFVIYYYLLLLFIMGFAKMANFSKTYNVIRSLVQIEIPWYSFRKMMGWFPSGEKTAPSFRFLRVFFMFFTETHGRGLGHVAHAPFD